MERASITGPLKVVGRLFGFRFRVDASIHNQDPRGDHRGHLRIAETNQLLPQRAILWFVERPLTASEVTADHRRSDSLVECRCVQRSETALSFTCYPDTFRVHLRLCTEHRHRR